MRTTWLTIYSTLLLTSALTYCPEKCSCDWKSNLSLTVNCSGTGQKSIPYGIDENVQILDLSHNEIGEYSDVRLFKYMTAIDLSNNKIDQVIFLSTLFPSLENVDLSDNHIGNLSKLEIHQLVRLKILKLSNNIKLNIFNGLKSPSLEFLDLSHCFIKYFEENCTIGIPNVKKIDLSYNSFKKIIHLRSNSLEELDVSNGNLNYLTEEHLSQLPNLKKLNVSFSKNLDLYFQNESLCFEITEIDLSNLELKNLRLNSFCNLELANISTNHISEIEETTFGNNTELIHLDLSKNDIYSVHKKSFSNTEKIRVLDLSYNFIQDVKFTMYLKNLANLNLSVNKLQGFHDMMLKNVVDLDVSHNKIYEIVADFDKSIPKLERLHLSYNLIEILTRIKSKSIKYLDLSYCQIISIKLYAFTDMRDLDELNLTGNKLVNLDYHVLAYNVNLKSVLLSHNPWSCDCNSEKFKNLYKFLLVNRTLTNGKDLRCIQRLNETWVGICAKEWHQENLSLTSRKTFYALISTFVMLLVIVVVFLVCRCLKKKRQEEESESDDRDRDPVRYEPRDRSLSSHFDVIRRSASVSDVRREVNQVQRSKRPSTPPPNYEDALLLPKLGAEQINLVMSSLSNLADQGASSSGNEYENRPSHSRSHHR